MATFDLLPFRLPRQSTTTVMDMSTTVTDTLSPHRASCCTRRSTTPCTTHTTRSIANITMRGITTRDITTRTTTNTTMAIITTNTTATPPHHRASTSSTHMAPRNTSSTIFNADVHYEGHATHIVPEHHHHHH
ncbi:unnamed protein product [Chrysodeixis includens]|uniref:Uncharacterized protein n=1 Tax=Chrysodeixis includens TaxID=689277 RepID=A0A9N8KU35_CHRIL|nr:unnamed protein product [Chrysodeixis includens]